MKAREVAYDRQQKLLSVLQDYAPTIVEQEACSKFFNWMKHEGLNDEEIECRLAGAIYDGLAYGNWLWTSNKVGG